MLLCQSSFGHRYFNLWNCRIQHLCTNSQIYKHYPIGPSRSDIIHETSKTLGIPAQYFQLQDDQTTPKTNSKLFWSDVDTSAICPWTVLLLPCFSYGLLKNAFGLISEMFFTSPSAWELTLVCFYGSPGCMLANSDILAKVRVDRIETTPSKMKHNRIISGRVGSLIIGGVKKENGSKSKAGGWQLLTRGEKAASQGHSSPSSLRSYVSHQCPFDYD